MVEVSYLRSMISASRVWVRLICECDFYTKIYCKTTNTCHIEWEVTCIFRVGILILHHVYHVKYMQVHIISKIQYFTENTITF